MQLCASVLWTDYHLCIHCFLKAYEILDVVMQGIKCGGASLGCLHRQWECSQCVSIAQYEQSKCQCLMIVDVHSNNCIIKKTLICVTLFEDVLFQEAEQRILEAVGFIFFFCFLQILTVKQLSFNYLESSYFTTLRRICDGQNFIILLRNN